MIGLGIILAHFVGDYILQNSWMAAKKTVRWSPAVMHGLLYGLAYDSMFLILGIYGNSLWRLSVTMVIIIGTHILIDRYRLVKQFIWGLNQLAPKSSRYSWQEAKANGGYSKDTPTFMSTWLMIIVDNTIHLLINTAVIVWILHAT